MLNRHAVALTAVLTIGSLTDLSHAAGPNRAANDPADMVDYTIQRGDTLFGLASTMLTRPADWRALARLNSISEPRRLVPGSILHLPAHLLKPIPDNATVDTVSGTASIDNKPLSAGSAVAENATVRTGEDSVVDLHLSDGSTVRIEPDSRVRLERLRRYHSIEAVEARLRLERGRVETQAATGRRRPLTIRTPLATAAVRGTQFRVSAEPNSATTEVLHGFVDWSRDGTARVEHVTAGQGARADAAGVAPLEPLLPGPVLDDLPGRTEREHDTFQFAPVTGARGYRVTINRDAEGRQLLSARIVKAPAVDLNSIADGDHFIEVRAIAATAVEGLQSTRRIDVQARPVAPAGIRPAERQPVFGEQVEVVWTQPAGVLEFQLETSAMADFSALLSSRQLNSTNAVIALQASGDQPQPRYWRIASIDAAGHRGPYANHEVRWQPDPVPPKLDVAGDDGMNLVFPAQPAARRRIELASDPTFAGAKRFETAESQYVFSGLAPGRYYVRVQTIDAEGFESPFTSAQVFEIHSVVYSGSGAPVKTGSGQSLQSSP